MKRDRNQHVGEGKGKRKKNDHGDEVNVVGPAGAGKEAAVGGGGKGGSQKSGKEIETFNPQLSARELKKIQYYENMFKKMERKREERQNEGDNKGKKKGSNARRMKKETETSTKEKGEESSGAALEESGEVADETVVTEEKGDDAKQSGVKETARGNSQKGEKDAKGATDAKEAKHKPKKENPKLEPRETYAYAVGREKQDEPQSMDGNERGKNNKWRKVEKSQMRIKKEELRMDKGMSSKMREGSNKAVTLKGKKCVENSNPFVSDSEGEGEEEDDELQSSERNPPRGDRYNDQSSASPKHYTYNKNGMAKAGKDNKVKEENRKSSGNHKMDGEKEHESDHDVNYDNDPNEMINFQGKRKIYLEAERKKRVLKIKRSFSVSSNINEYFFDTSSIQLMSDNDHSAYRKEEHSSGEDNENEPTFSYKKKKILQLLTRTDGKDNDTIHPLAVANNGSSSNNTEGGNYNLADSDKWLKWKNKKNYNIWFASNNNSRKRNKWHLVRSYDESRIETNERIDLHPNGKENFVDEQMNMNGRSNSTEYFINREDLPMGKKSLCEKKFNEKSAEGSSSTNMMMHANKKFDVNCCIRKYLDNMRYTNLKKLKKVNRGNLNLYVKGCTNFLNFDKVDSAILSMRKFQEALQRRGGTCMLHINLTHPRRSHNEEAICFCDRIGRKSMDL
ncbi:hypothetical protein PCYB_147600 [Plasmodium cynomolgi strain B]|uniref:Uncharacterized protein n=1 Tax=Plasmodium cynomolgi (strain B) TaxID=1120755 RepID=K6VIW5_PLACD|nr:hypothetical protein PCYB_147600 [Plasmodium cynomolgi strain B]GAB69332.1 hypothetical protein PCYB_147600 [Plasmodium cynomolgi strain B]